MNNHPTIAALAVLRHMEVRVSQMAHFPDSLLAGGFEEELSGQTGGTSGQFAGEQSQAPPSRLMADVPQTSELAEILPLLRRIEARLDTMDDRLSEIDRYIIQSANLMVLQSAKRTERNMIASAEERARLDHQAKSNSDD